MVGQERFPYISVANVEAVILFNFFADWYPLSTGILDFEISKL